MDAVWDFSSFRSGIARTPPSSRPPAPTLPSLPPFPFLSEKSSRYFLIRSFRFSRCPFRCLVFRFSHLCRDGRSVQPRLLSATFHSNALLFSVNVNTSVHFTDRTRKHRRVKNVFPLHLFSWGLFANVLTWSVLLGRRRSCSVIQFSPMSVNRGLCL